MPLKKVIYVAAAVLQQEDGRFFLVQRPNHKSMPGLWEFPGGKIEPSESPENALIREIKEELDLTIKPSDLQPLTFVSHPYDDFHLVMLVYLCKNWQGTLYLRENQGLYAWVKSQDLSSYPMPPADFPLIPLLENLKDSA